MARERAAWLVSEAGGFGVVPPTVLRDGPLGAGSVQLWVGPTTGEQPPLVDVLGPDEVPEGWLVVLEGESTLGEPVVVAHCAEPALRTVAVLDAALNNSDRKGSHLLREGDAVRGCDHGVSLGVESKLRTVLWGWAGEPLPDADVDRLERLAAALDDGLADDLAPLLTADEVEALAHRVDGPAAPPPAPSTARRLARHPVAGPVGGAP